MARPFRPVARAALAGLAAGLFLASGALLVMVLERARAPCEAPGTEQCVFEQQTAAEVSRLQSLAALGCALVGAGLAVAARRA